MKKDTVVLIVAAAVGLYLIRKATKASTPPNTAGTVMQINSGGQVTMTDQWDTSIPWQGYNGVGY